MSDYFYPSTNRSDVIACSTEDALLSHFRGKNLNGPMAFGIAYAMQVELADGVKRINAFVYYTLAKYVHDLMVIESGIKAEADVITVIVNGLGALKEFKEHEDPERFRSSFTAADALIARVQDAFRSILPDSKSSDTEIGRFGSSAEQATKAAIRHFESMLEKELSDLPLFCVEEQGNLSTARLIRGASLGYPSAVTKHLADFEKGEIDASGRCLAFREGTASGFHILRAIESLIKRYAVMAKGAELKKRDWGHYVEVLESSGADNKVTSIMHQINNLYRKPLMHPEDTLTPAEAVGLFSSGQSVIEALVADMLFRGFIP